ncbi:hypothetical protein [Pseudolysinimonas yzui]|uniref:Uncharacterized protein n=1 Tax=Pseudolysinimonas yzui TaxID=2708254 RepID=A0A8J3LZS4_9MICO|nr:hypothetical protein [Pseudolysinimonas yzui]GHF11211.1 hypothetical protein GCM10011600_10510 [Pseudolysinimonas yzui]
MTIRRTLATASATLLLLASLTACFGIPTPGGNTGGDTGGDTDTIDLSGTSWSGVDSDGDSWGLEFQGDGTVGLTYNGDSYDDASDTWTVSGDTLAIHVAFTDGAVDMTGPVAEDSIDLDGTYTGGTFTLTITQD